MDLSAMAWRLMRMVRGEDAGAGAEVDAADMGTAFGLEASMLDFEPSECDDIPVESRAWGAGAARR